MPSYALIFISNPYPVYVLLYIKKKKVICRIYNINDVCFQKGRGWIWLEGMN